MAPNTPLWGLVATLKATPPDAMAFAAHHLDLGAHRLFIYLDAPDPEVQQRLTSHPKIRIRSCDAAHWQSLGIPRPKKHQVRQCANATHAYPRSAEVDWLIHIDVDEFLWPQTSVSDALAALPPSAQTARVRPMEMLADGDGTAFKAFIPSGPDRHRTVERVCPTYGRYLKGGFLSHVAGKPFVRTGLGDLSVRIHNVFDGDQMNPGAVDLDQIALCHCHATGWDQWISAFAYRLERGSYRPDLAPASAPEQGGMTLHDLFRTLMAENGEAGLRDFFLEVCADGPDLRHRLDAEGLLRRCDLDLERKIQKHFPQK